MKPLKQILLFLLCAAMLCVLTPHLVTDANAATYSGSCGAQGSNVTWTLDTETGVLTISGTGDMENYSSSSKAPWKSYSSSIKRIQIGNGVTRIGNYAFFYCTSLSSVTIPDSVTSIGDWAFYYCTSLTSVTIPDSVTSIGDNAFSFCAITSVTIPDGMTSIGDHWFYACSALTSVTIPDSVTSIGNYAFYGCSLPSVTIPDSVTSIGKSAFEQCLSLTSVTIPDSVTSIGAYAFERCYYLTSVTIPDSVTSISDSMFCSCYSLTSVTIPGSVTSIGADAFKHCLSLTSVTIPDSVTTIGAYAFENCTALSAVHISDLTAWCNISFDGSFSNPLNCAHNLYLNGTLITDLAIPSSVTSIGDYAFYNCIPLTSVTIPDSVTSIGNYAFKDCASLNLIIRNPTCEIYDTKYTCDGVNHICAAEGSTAQAYATKYGIPFHEWGEWSDIIPATCTEQGTHSHVCSLCGETEIAASDALGHDLVELDREDATCTEDGEVFYRCSRCRQYITEELPALGHDWNEWAVTTAPTCTADGEEARTCGRCSEVETNVLSALGHDWSEWAVTTAPTCAEDGLETRACARCSEAETNVLSALGHDYQTVVTAPTCTDSGYTTYTCSRCQDSYVADEIEALGHDWSAWSTTTAPTCTEDGLETRTCARCSDVKTNILPALGHDYETAVMKDATIGKVGRMGVNCTRCDYYELVILPILSPEDYDLSGNTATCTEAGTATYTWKDTTYGVYSVEGPTAALGHDYVDVVTPPTMTEQGYTTHTCSCCDDSYIDSYVEAGQIEVVGMNLTVESDVIANAYLSIPDEMVENNDDLAVRLYNGDELLSTQPVNDATFGPNGYVFRTLTPAKEMQDTIRLELWDGEDQLTLHSNGSACTKVEYSVQYYLDAVIDADEGTYDDALVDLCKAMSDYGSRTQLQQKYTAIPPRALFFADAITGDQAITTADITKTPVTKTGGIDGVSYYGSSLVMDQQMELRLYFVIENADGITATIGEGAGAQSVTLRQNAVGEFWSVSITKIDAQDFNKPFTVTLTDGSSSYTVSGCTVSNYIHNVLRHYEADPTSRAPELVELVRAIANYGFKADAFFK